MKPLAIELTKGARLQLRSIGWRTPKESDCRRQFYALDETDKPLVVTPRAALPQFYDPRKQAPAIFTCEPFPEAVCVEISPCRLLAPPCYRSQADFEQQLPCHATVEPWKWIYWRTHHEVLTLKPEDDRPLKKRLDGWLAAMRLAYEREATSWRDEIRRVKTTSLRRLRYRTEGERAMRLAELRAQLDIVESDTPIEAVACKGRLKWTLEDIKRGHEGIREAWMHEEWAKKSGEDLGIMRRERCSFRTWLETHTGTRAVVFDSTMGERRHSTTPPVFGENWEQDPRFLEACASVRFRARFADNDDTVVYLTDCELRAELAADELAEVATLRASQRAQTRDSIRFQHSPDYRQLSWIENAKEEEARLTKKQASAFSALHHALHFTLAREEWVQEIYGDEPPSDFRPDKLFHYKDGRKVWDRFIQVEGDRYRLALDPQ